MNQKKRPAFLEAGRFVYLVTCQLYVNTTSVRCRNNHHHHNNYCGYYGNDINTAFQHKGECETNIHPPCQKKNCSKQLYFV